MEIAVLVNHDSGNHPFYDEGSIQIVSDKSGTWKKIRELQFIPLGHNGDAGLPEIHRQMQILVSNLGSCKAFVSPVIRGIPFAILDSEGFTIWQQEGELELLFDHIKKTLIERSEAAACSGSLCGPKSCSSHTPEPQAVNDNDEYSINLKKILDENDSLNSKDILVPFINKRSFKKLSVICDHTPRWLEKDFDLFNLLLEEEVTDEGTIVTLYPDPEKKHALSIPYPIGGCGKNHSSCFEG